MLLNRRFIYIVEANPQNRLVFRISLSRQGGWVEFEPLADRALDHLKRLSRVDLIILNLHRHGSISGYEVFDQIRLRDEFASVPIIGMTTFDLPGALLSAQARGFNGLIMKPIDINLFPRQIARVLDGETVWPAIPQNAAKN